MSNVGRNEPCPCGSGEKYKRCCLPYYEESINVEEKKITALLTLGQYSFSRYREFFIDTLGKFNMKELSSIEEFEDLLMEDDSIYPLDWFIFNEYVSKGKTLLELFLEEGHATSEQKEFLKNWRSTYWSFYKVKEVIPEVNRIDLFDLFLNKEYKVFDPNVEDLNVKEGEIALTRLIPYKGFYILGFIFSVYREREQEELKIFMNEQILNLKRENMSYEDLLKVYGYRLFGATKKIIEEDISNLEPDEPSPLKYRTIYRLNDYNRAASLLSLSPYFFRINSAKGMEAFNCIRNPKSKLLLDKEDIDYLGSVLIMKEPENLLIGLAYTKEELDSLKGIVEELLGSFLVYEKDEVLADSE
jgi:hypothetical protein